MKALCTILILAVAAMTVVDAGLRDMYKAYAAANKKTNGNRLCKEQCLRMQLDCHGKVERLPHIEPQWNSFCWESIACRNEKICKREYGHCQWHCGKYATPDFNADYSTNRVL